MKKETIIIGCSSYYNSYWQPVFYKEGLPRIKWFEYYCKYFDTYELNATFYKFPTVKSLQNWYSKAPDGFLFAVKAPKIITHIKKFIDCQQEIDDLYSIAKAGLKDKLGSILFQLPPGFDYNPQRLELILDYMDPNFINVVEFRNKSWWNQQVYDAFSKKNIVFCTVSYPMLPTIIIRTGPIGYVRLHGKPELFYSTYSTIELQQLYKQIEDSKLDRVFVYFNNTASTAGILNALEFKQAK